MTEAPRRPIVWPIFVLWLGVLGFVSVASTLLLGAAAAWLAARGALPNLAEAGIDGLLRALFATPGVLQLSMVITSATLLLAVFAGAKLERAPSLRDRLQLVARPRNALVGALGFVAVVTLGQAMEAAIPRAWLEGSTLEVINETVAHQGTVGFVLLLIAGSVGPGFTEELFFRGFAQSRLIERWGRWAGILVASVLFGVTHADKIHTPLAFVMGVLIGWIADRAGSIWPTIAAHGFNNASSFLLTRTLPPDFLHGRELVIGLGSAAVCVVTVASIAMLTRSSARPGLTLPTTASAD